MINQLKREEVIKLLDESSDIVKLEDLFLYDLSPYYQEKLNDSFFSRQVEYQKERDTLKHSKKNISFASEQKAVYKQILDDNNKRLILSAPTSFGKTMLVKEYIYNEQPDIVVFIVPTNSLADELIEDFVEIYSDLGYVIYDTVKEHCVISKKSIFIGTQEKFYNIYQDRIIDIDLFVIDEAYKLGDKIRGSREVILNRAFVDTVDIAQKTILLLPLANEVNGLSKLNFKVLKSDYSPVAKEINPIDDDDFYNTITTKISDNKESNLIYFNSPVDIEDFYLKYQNNFKINKSLYGDWFDRVEKDFHPEWIPIKALKNGIGIHYGPMPKFIQKKVVKLFESSELKTVLATSSIIEGVNTPTKNIFITTKKNLLSQNQVIKFKNLIGRAGRLGIHKVGRIFFMNSHTESFKKVNIPFTEISLKFILEDETPVIEINRESEFMSIGSRIVEDKGDRTFEVNRAKTVDFLKNSGLGKVPFEEISFILNKHGFTLNQVKQIIQYSKSGTINLFGILGKLKSSDNNLNCINEIIDEKLESITDILNELKLKNEFVDKSDSQLVSIIIKMIYNVIPHKVIPAIDFIIDLNKVYIKYNNEALFTSGNITEANTKKIKFFNKFIGEALINVEESKRIMQKLFEYGIPYNRVKNHLEEIVYAVPENFSIHDIKVVILNNSSMKELKVYFE